MRTGARGKKCEGRAERRRQRKMTAVYNQKNIFVIVCLSFPSARSAFLSAAARTENGVLFCFFHFIRLGDKTLSKDETGTFESLIFSCIILASTWITVTAFRSPSFTPGRWLTIGGGRLYLNNYVYYLCGITTVSMRGQNLANGHKIRPCCFLDDVAFYPWEKSKPVWNVCLGWWNEGGSHAVLELDFKSNYHRWM